MSRRYRNHDYTLQSAVLDFIIGVCIVVSVAMFMAFVVSGCIGG